MKKSLLTAPHRLVANDAYTFLMKELEKVDETILEPLTGTDWPRDMPVVTGGGLVENVKMRTPQGNNRPCSEVLITARNIQ